MKDKPDKRLLKRIELRILDFETWKVAAILGWLTELGGKYNKLVGEKLSSAHIAAVEARKELHRLICAQSDKEANNGP
jgi:hypothetical protein